MKKTKKELKDRYTEINGKVREISKNKNIKICCVTKYSSPKEINVVIDSGAKIIGENRIQEAIKKFPFIKPIEKHFIGNLQGNKVKKAIELFDVIQTIDSIKLAKKVNEISNSIFPIMLQLNIGKEPQKQGFSEEELDKAINEIKKLPNIKILGLMTILPNTRDSKKLRNYFKKMKKLNDKYNFQELSMGMTNDYKMAIEEGSTMVRIGSAIFK